ncbi:MAG: triose-phosphate isomerase [Pseudomonadota bacterium]
MSVETMTKKLPYIVSNWKMNGTKALLAEAIHSWQPAASSVKWIFCPPATLIAHTKACFPDIMLGGQDCSAEASGAFTGGISASQLMDVGAQYVIVGHSECRLHNNDANADVAAKAMAAHSQGLIPIICIGESEEVYLAGETLNFLKKQLDESLKGVRGEFLVAYEPIWAIGTGKTATNNDIEHVHRFLREQLPTVSLLYGGSVNAANTQAILEVNNIDGVLVGGASLKIDDFTEILKAGSAVESE